MALPDLRGRRALVLGAETALGEELARVLAEAGARLALISATAAAEPSFRVKRLGRRLASGTAAPPVVQAIDAANEMAVRVMCRQVAKEMGGLDLLFFCADLGAATPEALRLAARYGGREMRRQGGGVIVVAGPALELSGLREELEAAGLRLVAVTVAGEGEERRWAAERALELAAGAGD